MAPSESYGRQSSSGPAAGGAEQSMRSESDRNELCEVSCVVLHFRNYLLFRACPTFSDLFQIFCLEGRVPQHQTTRGAANGVPGVVDARSPVSGTSQSDDPN